MFGIVFKIVLYVSGPYIGWKLGKKVVKWLTKKQNKKKWNNIREKILNISARIHGNYIDIKKVPQVSFERFLKLYEVSPESWLITEKDNYGYDDYFPVYVKYDTQIPLFWETGEDFQKYREWVEKNLLKARPLYISRRAMKT